MKRILYTAAFVAFFGAMGFAQSAKPAKKAEPAAETVNPDGSAKASQSGKSQQPMNEEGNPDGSPKNQPLKEPASKTDGGDKPANKKTRMAITEKGVPASKSKETKDEKKPEPKAAGKN